MADPHYPMFIADLGFAQRLQDDVCHGDIDIVDEFRTPGSPLVRPALLLTVADVVAGRLTSREHLPRIVLTVDLTVHSLRPADGDHLAAVARLLKTGRTTSFCETVFTQPGSSDPVAVSHATFTPSPRPQDVTEGFPEHPFSEPRMRAPLADQLGIRVLRPGVAEIDRAPYVMQPAGTIQGGAVALLAEVAAGSATGAPIVDLDVRYLAAVRVGPARATATVLAPGVARVEVRDAGNADRLATVVMARAAA